MKERKNANSRFAERKGTNVPARRKSIEELERRGAFRKNPARGRARVAEMQARRPQRHEPFPRMPNAFQSATDRCARLRELWRTIECAPGQPGLSADNFDTLPNVCRLLYRCRYGRSTAEDRALAGRWLAVLDIPATFASKQPVMMPQVRKGFRRCRFQEI